MNHLLNSTDATEDANQPVPLPLDEAERPSPPKNLSENQGVVKAAAVLAVGNITSRVLGLVREIVKSNLFGASDLLGAYTVAALVPMTLFNLITGGEMVSSSLVPVFSDFASKERRQELWGVVSTFLSLAVAVLLFIVALVMLFTPQIAWLESFLPHQATGMLPPLTPGGAITSLIHSSSRDFACPKTRRNPTKHCVSRRCTCTGRSHSASARRL